MLPPDQGALGPETDLLHDTASKRADAGTADATRHRDLDADLDTRLHDSASKGNDSTSDGAARDKGPGCSKYSSGAVDVAPVQTVGPKLASGKLLPAGYSALAWARPTIKADYTVAFSGSPGAKASHEGVDLVIGKGGPADVAVRAIADGVVAYVRVGCPQTCPSDPRGMFCKNAAVRECGAGWGNHVVVDHGSGLYSRYAHLAPASVTARVGDRVSRGTQLALMGNSGRSESRHLHLELGTRVLPFDPCATSKSFDAVFDPAQLPW